MSQSNVYPTVTAICSGCKKNVAFLITQEDPRCPTCNTALLPGWKPQLNSPPNPKSNARHCSSCRIDFNGDLCPKCNAPGIPVPTRPNGSISLREAVKPAAVVVLSAALFWSMSIRIGSPSQYAATPTSEFLPAAGDITPGVQFYHKDAKLPVAAVKRVESNRLFPDGIRRAAVLLYFPNGKEEWIPRDAAKLLYVVRADDPKR